MLQVHRNALLQEILSAGFDRSLFNSELSSNAKHPTFTISFNEWELTFVVGNAPDDFHKFDYYYTLFGPGYITTDFEPKGYTNFDGVLQAFRTWLADHVRPAVQNLAVPDLWQLTSSVPSSSVSVVPAAPDLESRFSQDEREQIRLSLQRFHVLIQANFGPTPDEMAAIRAQLDYLSQALDRLNPYDWRGIALNAVISITITLSLDVERGRKLWGLFQQAFELVMHLIR